MCDPNNETRVLLEKHDQLNELEKFIKDSGIASRANEGIRDIFLYNAGRIRSLLKPFVKSESKVKKVVAERYLWMHGQLIPDRRITNERRDGVITNLMMGENNKRVNIKDRRKIPSATIKASEMLDAKPTRSPPGEPAV